MKKSIDLSELRALVREVLEEDSASPQFAAPAASRPTPPPLPKRAQPNQTSATPAAQPASAALPQKGALTKFKADVNMAIDAANRVQQNMDQANTKEALRWLDKMIQFATSAKTVLGTK